MWHYLDNQEKTKYLSQKEVLLLFEQITKIRDRVMFNMIYKFGLRVSEVGLLRIQDIKWDRNRIKIWRLKGGISREYLIFSDTAELLREYLKEHTKNSGTPLFLSRNGNPISRKTIDWHFKKLARQANLPKDLHHAHTLRHSIAVHMSDAGHSREDVQYLLGHKNIQSTERYMKISGRKQQALFEKMEKTDEIVRTYVFGPKF